MKSLWRRVGLKLLEEALSVKIQLIVAATILLICGKLDSNSYATIVVSLGAGRVLIDSIVAYRYKKVSISEEPPQE